MMTRYQQDRGNYVFMERDIDKLQKWTLQGSTVIVTKKGEVLLVPRRFIKGRVLQWLKGEDDIIGFKQTMTLLAQKKMHIIRSNHTSYTMYTNCIDILRTDRDLVDLWPTN